MTEKKELIIDDYEIEETAKFFESIEVDDDTSTTEDDSQD